MLIPTKTWYLQMFEPPAGEALTAPRGDLEIRRIDQPSCEVYRQLYRAVGSPWNWFDRLLMSDEQLQSILQDERVDVFLLCIAGEAGGYAELDRRAGTEIELAYFGLFPNFVGRGPRQILSRLDAAHCLVARASARLGSHLRSRSPGRAANLLEGRVSNLRRTSRPAARARSSTGASLGSDALPNLHAMRPGRSRSGTTAARRGFNNCRRENWDAHHAAKLTRRLIASGL